jgi:hypothetical protein
MNNKRKKKIFNLITPAKVFSPSMLTFTGSRDVDMDIPFWRPTLMHYSCYIQLSIFSLKILAAR